MNKIVKRSVIGIAIVIGIIVIFFAGFIFKMKSEIKTLKPVETGKIVSNIFAIKDSFVNMYIIKDSDQYIAIDAGNDIKAVKAELDKVGINPEKVVAVFLTHTDRDHVGALPLFKNALIYLSTQEELMLTGKKKKIFFITNKISTKEYFLLQDGQTIHIGNTTIQAISTPGHTSGSMCFLLNKTHLFVGDAMNLSAGKLSKPNAFFTMDNNQANESVRKILNLPEATSLFTAHTGFSSDYRKAVKDWK